MRLHSFFRSSASYRVRIALNLKGVDYDYLPVHLRKGEQRDPAYLALNPQGLAPVLETDDGAVLTQSLAIIEYLEETIPQPSLLPPGALDRARVRALAHVTAVDIQPINNLRVLRHLRKALGQDEPAVDAWYRHWIQEGFGALEQQLGDPRTGRFCHGDEPGLADICLVPQVFNAVSYDIDLAAYPLISRINQAALAHPAFDRAHPSNQPDAE